MSPNQQDPNQAALDAVEALYLVPEEAAYDRVMAVARDSDDKIKVLIKSKPDDQGQTRLFIKSADDIKVELRHDSDAKISVPFHDIEMKRAGLSDEDIVDLHAGNEHILNYSSRLIQDAQRTGAALPSVEDAKKKIDAPGYKQPATDSDFAETPMFNNEPAYRKVIGIARNMNGEPVALVESAPDKKSPARIFAMTEQKIAGQIVHSDQAMLSPGFSDPQMLQDLYAQGDRLGADARIAALHQDNQILLNGALEQMHDTLKTGAPLKSVQEAVTDYRSQAATPPMTPQPAAPVQTPAPAR